MESETDVNPAAAAVETSDIQNGYTPGKIETLTLDGQADGESNDVTAAAVETLTLDGKAAEESAAAAAAATKPLHQEIQSLKSDRSDLQAKLDEALAKLARSEAAEEETKSELRSLRDRALNADAEVRRLQLSLQDLDAEKSLLAKSKAELESKIRDLEAHAAAHASAKADLKAELENYATDSSKRHVELSVLREENEAAAADAKRRAVREEGLEKTVADLEMNLAVLLEKNAALQSQIADFTTKTDRALEVDLEKEKVEEVVTGEGEGEGEGLTVSWATAAAAAASTATVAVAITTICLRARQR